MGDQRSDRIQRDKNRSCRGRQTGDAVRNPGCGEKNVLRWGQNEMDAEDKKIKE
jgi:hypothetical protein